ncbi:tropomodulin-1-like [Dysidea avara]|uniref:tropomodulin-1-like n=1 Tax=Dysidea avara TaxID=196820 RepID=UPI00332F6201
MAKDELDSDAILAALSKEEIGDLVDFIDPDNTCLHPSERMPPQTTKEPTGPFDRDHLMTHLKQEAENSKIGEGYIPYKKDIRGKVYKEKEPIDSTKKEIKRSKFADELDQMLSLVEQDDLADLVSELGLEEASNQLRSTSSKASPATGLKANVYSYKSPAAKPPIIFPQLLEQNTDIEETIVRLQELDPTLTTLNLNNHPRLEEDLFQQLCDALVANTYLTTLELAGTKLGDNHAKMLVSVLKNNSTLQSLNLDTNYLTGAGIKVILQALKENNTLKELKLSNQKHSAGAGIEMTMAKMISSNTSLLKFGYSFTTPGPRIQIDKYIMRNTDVARQQRMLL